MPLAWSLNLSSRTSPRQAAQSCTPAFWMTVPCLLLKRSSPPFIPRPPTPIPNIFPYTAPPQPCTTRSHSSPQRASYPTPRNSQTCSRSRRSRCTSTKSSSRTRSTTGPTNTSRPSFRAPSSRGRTMRSTRAPSSIGTSTSSRLCRAWLSARSRYGSCGRIPSGMRWTPRSACMDIRALRG